MDILLSLLSILAGVLSAGVSILGGYYLFTALWSSQKRRRYGPCPPGTRFMILIPARNEEAVIPALVNSLLRQDYPRELYEIFVLVNGCTDGTAQAARDAGAQVLECTVPVRSKGDVLHFACSVLPLRDYDALCVFDSDNVVHPCFLMEMNNACCAGVQAAQGYRDSKNPWDSPVSGASSIYYWMMDRFYNEGRAALGLSALLNGTGFMVTVPTLAQLGGWRTETVSEDMEFTIQCALAGVKAAWVPEAVTYDEQPMDFRQSARQRLRWISGTLQVIGIYLPKLLQPAENWAVRADLCASLMIPAYQVALIVDLIARALVRGMRAPSFSWSLFSTGILQSLALALLFAILSAVLVLTVENKWNPRILKGLLFHPVFALSWLPLTVKCLIRPDRGWKPIRHGAAPRRAKKIHSSLDA